MKTTEKASFYLQQLNEITDLLLRKYDNAKDKQESKIYMDLLREVSNIILTTKNQ